MIKAIKDWLKGQFIFFLRGATPSIRHNICIICRNLATRKNRNECNMVICSYCRTLHSST
jgi:hypothetical protein